DIIRQANTASGCITDRELPRISILGGAGWHSNANRIGRKRYIRYIGEVFINCSRTPYNAILPGRVYRIAVGQRSRSGAHTYRRVSARRDRGPANNLYTKTTISASRAIGGCVLYVQPPVVGTRSNIGRDRNGYRR